MRKKGIIVRKGMKIQKQISQKAYRSTDGFLRHYQQLVKDVVIPYQYTVLQDKAEGVEKSHVIQNFVNAGKALAGQDVGDGFYGMVFQDSDLAKWLEAVAYILEQFPDAELEQIADELIDLVEKAQDSDGYLNTYFTIKDKEKRWTNLLEGHELYCSGHMMEAAVAYYETTGKDKLLRIMERNAEHIYKRFVTEKTPGYPGHPEVELALLKMYRACGNRHCLELAKHFIDVRGVDANYYEKEIAARDWIVWGNDATNYEYQQSGKPVREQKDATGHSVRAVYLYTGMADLASETDDEELLQACRNLWKSVVHRRMYVTGGIGSSVEGEAFTVDYDLPNDTAYAETCASIGLMFFASRMLENEVKREYADIMELAFYNTVLAGMQLDGKRFFYVNPLEVLPGTSGVIKTHRHTLPARPTWYACACCPPNVARLLASFGKYAYGENEDMVFCHMYAAGTVAFENGMEMECKTGYPYEYQVTYEIKHGGKGMAVRVPAYSKEFTLLKNGKEAKYEMRDGYVYLEEVQDGDVIVLKLDGTAQFVYTSSKVAANTGMTAIKRGPLVYCFEGVDNAEDVLSLRLKKDSKIEVRDFDAALLGGTEKITVEALRMQDAHDSEEEGLYMVEPPVEVPCTATAVPYYTWGNRGENQMRVWINYI